MRKNLKINFTAVVFAVLIVIFVTFCIYMLVAEHNEVHSVRNETAYKEITDAVVKVINDSSAPLGVRKQYSFSLNDTSSGRDTLIFYTVHQLVEVQIGGETVYSLTAGNNGIVLLQAATGMLSRFIPRTADSRSR